LSLFGIHEAEFRGELNHLPAESSFRVFVIKTSPEHPTDQSFLRRNRSESTGYWADPIPKLPFEASAAMTRNVIPSGASFESGTKKGASKRLFSPA
jgi:hypothetical protein